MKKISVVLFATTLLAANALLAQTSATTNTEKTVEVGGAAMYPSKNIVANALNSKDHTTLLTALKAADLVETLQGTGPFTVFAPTNAAFGMLPAGTVNNLLKPENKAVLTNILTYHLLAGKFNAEDIARLIKDGKGSAVLTTVSGGKLTASMEGKKLALLDEKGHVGYVIIKDVNQSNGVIHVIDQVLLPK